MLNNTTNPSDEVYGMTELLLQISRAAEKNFKGSGANLGLFVVGKLLVDGIALKLEIFQS